ncbi:MAG: hypothetical protein QNJ30_16830 [Kiloniellales bacterium]|nr:hypothetical protein [Kiloniellales bacterium]
MTIASSSKVVPILVTVLALASFRFASAAGDADQAKGIIAEHCADCHAVPGYGEGGSPALEAPPLQVFADDPTTYSEERLRTSLRQPHWPMSQFRLSATDIDNILAFIAELKGGAR